jgi:hypothetical protein
MSNMGSRNRLDQCLCRKLTCRRSSYPRCYCSSRAYVNMAPRPSKFGPRQNPRAREKVAPVAAVRAWPLAGGGKGSKGTTGGGLGERRLGFPFCHPCERWGREGGWGKTIVSIPLRWVEVLIEGSTPWMARSADVGGGEVREDHAL